MDFEGVNIGYALTGSFCTFEQTIEQIKRLVELKANVYPVFSFNSQQIDTRFGKAEDFMEEVEKITGNKIIKTIAQAEPLGPKNFLDVFIIAPCTGNTIAKMNNGICDTPVLMASKAHIRNNKPVIIAISTNDALGANMENIAGMINKKNIYFVPFGQDDYIKKPKSIVAHFDKIPETIYNALRGQQLQPILKEYN
ncbi:dipicolinate synthase subunit B [uncultured Tyzzerella sp.]|uniref:dipicolinate synthase subunit B n=1 Tax=uncultured Tyzzerella sp. TaxID=2321398 RepID=UPI002942AC84|nr:dipicolinate synthase subunit B [uncultured Tyzzerella sp.]